MKLNRQTIILWALLLFVIILIYHPWFGTKMIARGDWKAFSANSMLNYLGPPSVWNEADNGGFSMLTIGALARYPLLNLQANLHKIFGLGFALTERLIWFLPFLVIAAGSIYLLSKYLFGDTFSALFAAIYFIANDFIIFRLHGAQMNLALGYALTPLSLYFFIRSLVERRPIFALLNGISLSLAAYYEVRIAVLMILLQIAYGFYYIFIFDEHKGSAVTNYLKSHTLAAAVILLLNLFWLLPTALDFRTAVPFAAGEISSAKIVKSLSRTDFFNALALSIGADSKKGGFIYLDGQLNTIVLLPILALIYGLSLLARPRREYMFWYLSAIGLAFLAKGLNPPFAGVNAFFYDHIPLAEMFRLPTKFLMAGGTSIALMFGLGCGGLLSRIRSTEWRAPTILALSLLPILVIFPALFGSNSLKSMGGGSSFKPFVSAEYFRFEDELSRRTPNFKSVFLPGAPSYNFFNSKFPRYEPASRKKGKTTLGSYFRYRFGTVNGLKSADDRVLPAVLRLLNVKYIFLAPPDDTMWPWFVHGTRDLFWNMLSRTNEFKKTKNENVFVIGDPLPRFYISRRLAYYQGDLEPVLNHLIDSQVNLGSVTLVSKKVPQAIDYREVEPYPPPQQLGNVAVEKSGRSRYRIVIGNPPKDTFYLNFQDRFDAGWRINDTVAPQLSAAGTNYFTLTNDGNADQMELTLEHKMQRYVDWGWRVTQISWLAVAAILVGHLLRARRHKDE